MQRQQGFSLIELMTAVVIIGILTAVAMPAYTSYVLRTRLAEAFTGLSGLQPSAEQYWSSNRTYSGFAGLPPDIPSANFTYTLSNPTASSYTVIATGRGPTAGFVFTIDQNGNRATTGVPAGWTANSGCWVNRKEGTCVQ